MSEKLGLIIYTVSGILSNISSVATKCRNMFQVKIEFNKKYFLLCGYVCFDAVESEGKATEWCKKISHFGIY